MSLKNLPNYLTILRIAVVPIIIATFYYEDSREAKILGASLFAGACVTDFLDGYFARKWNIISKFGKAFDPIADKLLVSCVILMLTKFGLAEIVPCLLILAREIFVSGLREFLAHIKVGVPVSGLAKIKTFTQMVALTLLILGSKGSGFQAVDCLGRYALWIAASLTIVTGFSYFVAFYKKL